jgi:hypothetical protein
MSHHWTACLTTQEGNVRQFLENHGHTYVETLGPFTGGDLVLNTCPPPDERARLQGVSDKVLVHTTGP